MEGREADVDHLFEDVCDFALSFRSCGPNPVLQIIEDEVDLILIHNLLRLDDLVQSLIGFSPPNVVKYIRLHRLRLTTLFPETNLSNSSLAFEFSFCSLRSSSWSFFSLSSNSRHNSFFFILHFFADSLFCSFLLELKVGSLSAEEWLMDSASLCSRNFDLVV